MTKERLGISKAPKKRNTVYNDDGSAIKSPGGQYGARDRYDDTTRLKEQQVKQDAFLAAYPEFGSIKATVKSIAHILESKSIEGSQRMVSHWLERDNLGFIERFAQVKMEHAEYLETLALDRVKNAGPQDKIGSDVLLIALLNANNPQKFKRFGDNTDKSGAESLKQLRIIANHLKIHPELAPATPEDDRESNKEAMQRLLADRFPQEETDAGQE